MNYCAIDKKTGKTSLALIVITKVLLLKQNYGQTYHPISYLNCIIVNTHTVVYTELSNPYIVFPCIMVLYTPLFCFCSYEYFKNA